MNTYAAILGLAAAAVLGLAMAGCSGHGACRGACAMKPAPATAPQKEVAMDTKEKPELNTAALATLIRAGAPMVVFDARSGKYDDGRRIPGARSLSAESTAEEVAKLIPSKEALVVTYCANLKCPASAMLAAHLRKLGYTNVVEYPYGIEGWAAADMKVEMQKK